MSERCAAPNDFIWKAPDFKERVVVGTGICGHLKSRHWGNLCLQCDREDKTAGMHHAYTPGIKVDGTWQPKNEVLP
jgi:hypothetical protein